jgi:Uma2 family endonuclease
MTAEELFALAPDAGFDRWLFSGKLVERWYGFHSPAHAGIVATLAALLFRMRDRSSTGHLRILGSGCPYQLTHDPDTVVSFDASVIESHRVSRRMEGHLEGPPLLAVEVKELDEDEDVALQLVERSLEAGVPSMWVIDPFDEIVIWHRRDARPVYINGGMELLAGSHLPGFSCRVAELFE